MDTAEPSPRSALQRGIQNGRMSNGTSGLCLKDGRYLPSLSACILTAGRSIVLSGVEGVIVRPSVAGVIVGNGGVSVHICGGSLQSHSSLSATNASSVISSSSNNSHPSPRNRRYLSSSETSDKSLLHPSIEIFHLLFQRFCSEGFHTNRRHLKEFISLLWQFARLWLRILWLGRVFLFIGFIVAAYAVFIVFVLPKLCR